MHNIWTIYRHNLMYTLHTVKLTAILLKYVFKHSWLLLQGRKDKLKARESMPFPETFSSISPGVEPYFWKLKWCCILIADQLFYAPPRTNLEAFPCPRLLNWSLYTCVYLKVWKCVAKWRWSYWEGKETQPSCIKWSRDHSHLCHYGDSC